MSYTFTANLDLKLSRSLTNQPHPLGPITKSNSSFIAVDVLNLGTGDNKANTAFHDVRTITAGANDDLDLSNSLRNAFGILINFVKVKFIGIKHLTESASDSIRLGGGSDCLNNWTKASGDQLLILPGGTFMWWAPVAGAATAVGNDVLRVTNLAAGSIDYEVLIIGTTA